MAKFTENMTTKFQRFLDEIGWDEFNNVEKQYFFDDIARKPDGGGTILRITPGDGDNSKFAVRHIDSDTVLILSKNELKAFRKWLEEKFAQGEDGSLYYAWKEAIQKDESPKVVYEYDIAQKVLSALQKYYSTRRISRGYLIADEMRPYMADFVTFGSDGSIHLVIEVKKKSNINGVIFRHYTQTILSLDKNAIFVLTDGEIAIYSSKDGKYKIEEFNVFLKNACTNLSKKNRRPTLKSFTTHFKQTLSCAKMSSTINTVKYKKLTSYINNLRFSDFQTDTIDTTTWHLTIEKERELFGILLGEYTGDCIVKFSSKRCLNYLVEDSAIGMCSLVCMNDPSEKGYANSFIGAHMTTDDYANTFILSACNENAETNLTMWRLYGDDTKGVCIKLWIDTNKLNKNGFYLAPVSYAKSEKDHFELEIIKNLLTQHDGEEWKIELTEWHIWKHFFKQHIYAVEEEIRLIYIPSEYIPIEKSVWFTDDRTSIYSEMKVFDLSHETAFPLSLNRVILGTNFPSRDTNVEQYNRRFAFSKISIHKTEDKELVSRCDIENYR